MGHRGRACQARSSYHEVGDGWMELGTSPKGPRAIAPLWVAASDPTSGHPLDFTVVF